MYDPAWDERLYEIRRMPIVQIQVGLDLVNARTAEGSVYYILKEDWTPPMAQLVAMSEHPEAVFISLEKENSDGPSTRISDN